MIIIKVGGNAISQLDDSFFEPIQDWLAAGEQVVIIHGGGQLITEASQFFDLPTTKIDGIRVTPPAVLSLTEHLLTNVIQDYFAKLFEKHGISCLKANQDLPMLLECEYLNQDRFGEVGQVTGIDQNCLNQLPSGQVVLLNSLAKTKEGQVLNVNADAAAQALASLTNADHLILLTDVPGVLVDQHLLERLQPKLAAQLIAADQITGGMLPKVHSAFAALHHGVQKITITNQLQQKGTELTL
ncbi:acetylglutamate kinase [Fructobacillus pseudoficulneus]|uniref:acetylglutamate kinase n=1 Tax=Fructobacillus pseudoficulneus TaxID=220714 RepID=A0A3F3H2Z8_9LACO|nr:acetylglutamate kinase [Fructobacillus pseudoficulneus]GAP02888.1 acetylglutamate kinase [Fructobacillus pseudoficulneus]SEH45406.1 N-acetylglutamate kinase [Fructobacillus pseudoficulneus]